ncbi:MAG: exopolysaccharide biosynthesis polyprenyl glycosylphosphotransferase [Patescibacteria group bacterium]
MPNFIIKTKKLLLLGGDIIILYLSLFLTLILRYGTQSIASQWNNNLAPFTLIFALWLIIFFISDLYDFKTNYGHLNLINLLLKSFIINGIVSITVFYFLSPIFTIKPQRILIIELIIAFVMIYAWRRLFLNRIISSKSLNHALVIGQSPLAESLKYEIETRPQLGYKLLIIDSLPINLKDYCLEKKINILIVSQEARNNVEFSKKIFDCLSLGIDVYNLNGFYEQITNKIPVEYIDYSWFLENLSENSKTITDGATRIFDIVLSLVGLAISLPFWPFIILGIKINSKGPIFIRQKRVGKNGEIFPFKKFRSMIANAPDGSAEGASGPVWASVDDNRVTKFGRIIRKTRIDELPQLLNILKGEMSFVGPRPERPEFTEILTKEIPFYEGRFLVKPGLTGWAQLKGPSYGGSKEESLEKLKYDLYYIKHRSFTLDLSIILKTLRLVVGGKGQ